MRLVAATLSVVLVGCGASDAGYAVDLTLVADTNISTSNLATLRFSVSGVETDSREIGIEGKFSSREETLRYKPAPTTTGVLDFTFTLVDREGTNVGFGAQRGVTVQPGTYQKFRVTLTGDGGLDLATPGDMNRCGNGMVDTDETCDPTSPAGCPTSVADCDDQNDCTSDSLSGSGCQATCTHTPANGNSACLVRSGDAGTSGICLNGQCCTGCIKSGQCKPGDSNARECGNGGNDCFDCTMNSASATCNGGTCSGCDATSCTADGRTCGTSSCGFNCGGCPDACTGAGVVTKYACVNKSCQAAATVASTRLAPPQRRAQHLALATPTALPVRGAILSIIYADRSPLSVADVRRKPLAITNAHPRLFARGGLMEFQDSASFRGVRNVQPQPSLAIAVAS